MCKIFCLALIVSVIGRCAFCQSTSTLIGARSSSMANASACLDDVWSLFNNVAGLASIEDMEAGFTHEVVPSFSSFNRVAAVVAIPAPVGVAGMGVYRFGDDLYHEHIVTAGYANKFGLAALGGKINYVQYYAEGVGQKQIFTFSFGGIAQLTPSLSVGAHITNVNQPEIGEDEHVPTILTAGIGYKFTKKAFGCLEVEKDLDYTPIIKAGFEYEVYKRISLRSGFAMNPNAGYAGVGFRQKHLALSYSVSFFNPLGVLHQATINVILKKKKK